MKGCMFFLVALVFFSINVQAQISTSYTGGNLAPEIEQIQNLAQSSKSCRLTTAHYEGFGVCFTGSPSMLQAKITCDNARPISIALEDPEYYFCPPAKLFNSGLGNHRLAGNLKNAWYSLDDFGKKMGMNPYLLFRLELIQTLNSAGLQLIENSAETAKKDLRAADFSGLFERQ